MHLCVWDARRANPELSDVEIADLIHVPINTIVDGMAQKRKTSIKSTVENFCETFV